MLEKLIADCLRDIRPTSGGKFVSILDPTIYHSTVAAALLFHKMRDKTPILAEEYEKLTDGDFVKKFNREFARRMKRSNVLTCLPDSKMKKLLDENVFLSRQKGFPSLVWVKREDGSYFAAGHLTEDKIIPRLTSALRYETHPDVLSAMLEEYTNEKYLKEATSEKEIKFPSFAKWLADFLNTYWIDFVTVEGEIEPLTWSDTDDKRSIVRLKKEALNKSMGANEPTPNWDEFLSRLSHPEIFKAWVWSLFSGTHKTRQILWIQGNGNDGKSTVTRALRRMLGEQITASINLHEVNQFTTVQFLNKRFAIESDARYGEIIDHPLIFKLSGCDPITFEGKGKDAFTGIISCHVMICANIPPKIDVYSDAQVSRLLYLTVESVKKDPDEAISFADDSFEDRLVSEMYPFLASCAQSYLKANNASNRIPVPSDMARMIRDNCRAMKVINIEDCVKELTEPAHGGKGFIGELAFQKLLSRALKKRDYKFNESLYNTVKNYLTKGLGCVITEGRIQGIIEKTLN
jgi:hypothetical protein